jgi:hypothetical protein
MVTLSPRRSAYRCAVLAPAAVVSVPTLNPTAAVAVITKAKMRGRGAFTGDLLVGGVAT